MAIDLQRDSRRLRQAVLAGAILVLLVLCVAGAQALRPEWRKHQSDFKASGAVGKDRDLGLVQAQTCTGDIDRCATCHLGAERKDLTKLAQPLKAHSIPLDAHTSHGVGCSDCHGGSGRALSASVAHAFPGSTSQDPMMKEPHIQASCARCHVPGETKGMERLVHGANLFAQYGCGICHPLSGSGRGGWDFGPDLRSGGRKSASYLETSLVEPAANFPESTMPSFVTARDKDKEGFTDLLLFLESLELPRAPESCSLRQRSSPLASAACASCHAGDAGKASGRLKHRCVYLLEHKELACAGCHPAAIPAATAERGGSCPVEIEHRGACAACHDSGSGGAR